MGVAAAYFFLVFFNIGGEFLVNVAGFVIPAYYSLQALFSVSKVDDTQVTSRCGPMPSYRLTPPAVVDRMSRCLFPHRRADRCLQYWVVFAFLTCACLCRPHATLVLTRGRVFESAVNAVYWFPFFYTFKFILVLWLALPQFGYVPLCPRWSQSPDGHHQWRPDHLPFHPAARVCPLLRFLDGFDGIQPALQGG